MIKDLRGLNCAFTTKAQEGWCGAKPPRLKRGDAVRILKGLLAHHVGLYYGMKPHELIEVLLSLLGDFQRVTLRESDV